MNKGKISDATCNKTEQNEQDCTQEPAICGTGNKAVNKDESAMQCDMCHFWHHTECEAVSEQMYKFIQEVTQGKTVAAYTGTAKNATN